LLSVESKAEEIPPSGAAVNFSRNIIKRTIAGSHEVENLDQISDVPEFILLIRKYIYINGKVLRLIMAVKK
jgi:hypothetical protein